MYSLPYHKAEDHGTMVEFIRSHPFAFVSGCSTNLDPVATQLPLFLEQRGTKEFLRGHLMRNTDHHKAFLENPQVLAVFTGKHTYVSGSWYSDPHTASTWNYMSIHARGKVQFLEGEALEEMLRMTSLHFEDQNEESPTVYDNLPESFKKRVLHAIVAFEIEVESLDSVFKLSQDRDETSYLRIIQKLKSQGDDGRFIAAEMEKRFERLFPKTR